MNTHPAHSAPVSMGLKITAAVALIFGLMTLYSAGSVLFGPAISQDMAGAYVDFVVWFNFAAGFFYVAAAIAIWFGYGWACRLSALIALATALTAVPFAIHVMGGGAFEMHTVGALVLRIGFWAAIALVLRRSGRHG